MTYTTYTTTTNGLKKQTSLRTRKTHGYFVYYLFLKLL